MNTVTTNNEPSAELQRLAHKFVKNHTRPDRPRNELLSEWCEHLQRSSPKTLDLPIMQLIKAIVRAARSPGTTAAFQPVPIYAAGNTRRGR